MIITRNKRFYKSELTVADSGNKGKSLLGIIISIVVLLIISSMIVAAIVIINPDIGNISGRQNANREAITLEESILNELSARDIEFRWMSGASENKNSKDDLFDQLLWEDNKNIQLATLPSSEHRNTLLANRSSYPRHSTTGAQQHQQQQQQNQQQQSFKPEITTLVSNASLLSSIEFQGYKLSPSKRYLLIWTARKKQFRHSFTAKYFLYDIKLDLISLLSTSSNQRSELQQNISQANSDASEAQRPAHNHYEQLDSASIYLNDQIDLINDESARFQVADWFSSDLAHPGKPKDASDSLLLIQNNDIYILGSVAELSSTLSSSGDSLSSSSSSSGNNYQAATPVRLTWSGKQNEIFNGLPDWLYEEEILGDTAAFQVSPSGSRLAYMSFNDSRVLNMPFSVYGDQVIPRIQRIKYPKTGTPNPTVSVHIVENLVPSSSSSQSTDNNQRNHIELQLPEDLARQQHYINRITWLTDQRLGMIWSNRNQNVSHILICSKVNNWKCEKNMHLSAAGGWLDMSDDLYALDDEYYLALLPKFEGPDVGSFKHLARVSLNKANSYNFITSGRKDVISINGVDSKRLLVYYTSTVVDEPGQRQLFVAELESTSSRTATATIAGKQQSQPPTNNNSSGGGPGDDLDSPGASVCVTCDHYPSECLYNIAKMSPSTNYYVFYCEGPGVPRIELRATRRRRHRLSHMRTSSTTTTTTTSASAQDEKDQSNLLPGRLRTMKLVETGEQSQPQSVPVNKINDTSADSNKLFAAVDGHQSASNSRDYINATVAAAIAADNNKQIRQQQQTADDHGLDLELQADEAIVGSVDDVEANSNSGQENLLWTIEDNKDLRDKLEHSKAMPLTMRLKVPIAGTSYSANVMLLLPPQLAPTTTLKSSSSPLSVPAPQSPSSLSFSGSLSMSNIPQRPRRGAVASGILSGRHSSEDRPLHSYYTSETIGDYSNQLNNGQRFPMVVDVYAGPGSQRVDYRFNVYFGHYLASSRRTVYATIDGRGSGYQGTKRLYEIYHKFGTVEIQDQIDVAAYLAKNLTFIDPAKVAIWGWSYGGYAAAMALAQSNARAYQQFQAKLESLRSSSQVPVNTTTTTSNAPTPTTTSTAQNPLWQTIISSGATKSKSGPIPTATTTSSSTPNIQPPSASPGDSINGLRHLMRLAAPSPFPSPPSLRGVFECAVSVAPVTNWIYYDTAYTEKYMSSPWANEYYDQSMVGDHFSASIFNNNNDNNNTTTTNASADDNHVDRRRSVLLSGRPTTITTTTSNRWSPLNQTIDLESSKTRPLPAALIRAQRRSKKSSQHNQGMDLNERYRRASLLEQIANIDRKRFLLIHGTADDNVHFQQSVMLMKRLIQSNILFETRLYPDQDHSIANKADKLHLGSTLSNFFAECFDMAY